jgi:glycine cleavage system T protein
LTVADQQYSSFFNKDLAEIDPDAHAVIGFEEERQTRRFILIPSESIAPLAVRQALGSVFNNVYAEGYPPLRMTREEEKLILEQAHQMTYYRRYSDRRFYKGTEYADVVEALAQRRCAECFATKTIPADAIHVNVQPLSGAAANLAVYQTFLRPGDTLMGLNLFQGGHLTHGSEFNLSGRLYKVVSYSVDRATGRLNYEAIRALACEHHPKIIVAGYTSYPWAPDWRKFREIADEAGALLMADIAHTAGMAVAGAFPTPVGYADIITFTTHKTICGPRGAVIMATDEEKGQLLDAAVFPGAQGGPHVNKFAAMAVAFKIAQTEPFRRLQYAIVENAGAFANSLTQRGLKLAYGGTDTHLLLVDLRSIKTRTGFPLRGEMAARILDLCGIVVNKNTIPGDEVTALGSGIRMGTPWVTQRGLKPEHLDQLADVIARVLTNIQPFAYMGATELPRGKIELDILEKARRDVDSLAARTLSETKPRGVGYPHFTIVPEKPKARLPLALPTVDVKIAARGDALLLDTSDAGVLHIAGWRAKPCLQQVSTSNIAALAPDQAQRTLLLDADGALLDDVAILRLAADERGRDRYLMLTNPANTVRVKSWLRGLGDGYILFDREDIFCKVEGPVTVEDLWEDELPDPSARRVSLALAGPGGPKLLQTLGAPDLNEGAVWHGKLSGIAATVARLGYGVGDVRCELLVHPDQAVALWAELIDAGAVPRGTELRQSLRARAELPDYVSAQPSAQELYSGQLKSWFCLTKPYFVGQDALKSSLPPANKDEFIWRPPENAPTKRTVLYEEHRRLTTKIIPFAGWDMPVWYTSVSDEHQAVRTAAGLFDVAHMGVLEVTGEHAASFLDVVASNYARWIDPGQSAYAYLFAPDGKVIDDIIMYRRAWDRYLLVVNASNAEKDLAWLRAVNSRRYVIDRENPAMEIEGQATIRDLKDPSSGTDRRVDLALQGPKSLAILQSLTQDERIQRQLARIRRTEHTQVELAGIDLIAARTGYTGEEWGFELLVHPDRAVGLWNLLLERGAPFGLKPCALGARDSTRIEAGLPLYGHELAGDYGIAPAEAGFPLYVKFHKPFFVGRKHCLEVEANLKMAVVRFRVNETGVRALRGGDPVVNKRGQYIGRITSCTLVGNRQVGLAFVERRYNEPGTEIGVFPSAHGEEGAAKAVKDLISGDKVPLCVWAAVLNRFPDKVEKAGWGAVLSTDS